MVGGEEWEEERKKREGEKGKIKGRYLWIGIEPSLRPRERHSRTTSIEREDRDERKRRDKNGREER